MLLAFLFVVIAVLFHVIVRPVSWLGFTPIAAALLYFGAKVPRKWMWAPLALMIAGDCYLTLVSYRYAITADHFVTWGWYAAIILLGGAMLRENARPLRLIGASLSASVSFFVLSNFAVWLVWDMYPHTMSGLTACYVAGVPFFRNAVVGDLLFTAAFFGIGALAESRLHQPVELRVKK